MVVDACDISPAVKVEVANVDVPVTLSSPAMVRVFPNSKVSSALERKKSEDERPPTVSPTQVPPIAKQPSVRSIPLAKVEVAVVDETSNILTDSPPEKVDVAVEVEMMLPPVVSVVPVNVNDVLSSKASGVELV